ncbi:hypothetical protein BJ508DRAFT_305821 [Ascobolus immersus RN42]|uniref:Uncharacterized protein n=1 Tax=Ascobolus immersus RN42 TaxID=1160509 RepID=A0A3N4I7V0_ASCIM|nr:hypothetical protein BJ508DRAFT_305821 [Ascobolus immersus RN42]
MLNFPKRPTKASIIKKSWGSFPNFMSSYGMKMDNPDDIEEANQILEMLLEGALEKYEENKQALLEKEQAGQEKGKVGNNRGVGNGKRSWVRTKSLSFSIPREGSVETYNSICHYQYMMEGHTG